MPPAVQRPEGGVGTEAGSASGALYGRSDWIVPAIGASRTPEPTSRLKCIEYRDVVDEDDVEDEGFGCPCCRRR